MEVESALIRHDFDASSSEQVLISHSEDDDVCPRLTYLGYTLPPDWFSYSKVEALEYLRGRLQHTLDNQARVLSHLRMTEREIAKYQAVIELMTKAGYFPTMGLKQDHLRRVMRERRGALHDLEMLGGVERITREAIEKLEREGV